MFLLPLECPELPRSITNGYVNGTGWIQGSLYRFSCIVGYSLVGQETLSCTRDGQWNGSIPACLKGNVINVIMIY